MEHVIADWVGRWEKLHRENETVSYFPNQNMLIRTLNVEKCIKPCNTFI